MKDASDIPCGYFSVNFFGLIPKITTYEILENLKKARDFYLCGLTLPIESRMVKIVFDKQKNHPFGWSLPYSEARGSLVFPKACSSRLHSYGTLNISRTPTSFNGRIKKRIWKVSSRFLHLPGPPTVPGLHRVLWEITLQMQSQYNIGRRHFQYAPKKRSPLRWSLPYPEAGLSLAFPIGVLAPTTPLR